MTCQFGCLCKPCAARARLRDAEDFTHAAIALQMRGAYDSDQARTQWDDSPEMQIVQQLYAAKAYRMARHRVDQLRRLR